MRERGRVWVGVQALLASYFVQVFRAMVSVSAAALVSTLLLLFVSSTVALDPAGSPGKSRKGQTPSELGVPEPQSCEEQADGTCKEQVVAADAAAPVSDWFRSGSAEHVSLELYEQINVNIQDDNRCVRCRRHYVRKQTMKKEGKKRENWFCIR